MVQLFCSGKEVMKVAKVFYIDSENVGDSWFDLLETSYDKIFVFYTGRSPRIAYPQAIQLMNATNKPEFVKCYEGNNGLDFQLVSYLGYELHADNSNEMIIVSNDTGFDTVVNFWIDRGMNVKRVTSSNLLNSQFESEMKVTENTQSLGENEPVSDDEYTTESSFAETESYIYGIEMNELHVIINCIGSDNPSWIYGILLRLYGSENGRNIYNYLKKEKFSAPNFEWKNTLKVKKLIELIIHYHYVEKPDLLWPDNLADFILDNVVDDRKFMKEKFEKAYGTVEGLSLYLEFRPFCTIFTKLKNQ